MIAVGWAQATYTLVGFNWMTNWLRRGLLTLLTCVAAYPLLSALGSGTCNLILRPAAVPRDTPGRDLADKMVVEARCHNFIWSFRWITPNAGMREDFQLTLPADREVELRLASDDYIYTFDLDTFGIHQVVIPGQTYRCHFVTREPQSLQLIADPLCGFRLFHDEVMGRIVIVEHEEFRKATGFPSTHPDAA